MALQTTPLMHQYKKIKSMHKDKILFFRMGDFFEMFDQDAEIVAPILNIALTYRNKKAGLKTKMCGVPHHSISAPISKLLSEGLQVAICDQIEPATPGKSLVKRAVTRVLSPGMVYDLDTLDQLMANYMGAFDKNHISFLDLSTGSAFYYELSNSADFFKLLEQFQPRELVVTLAQKEKCSSWPKPSSPAFSLFDRAWPEEAFLPVPSLKRFSPFPQSAKRLVHYVYCTQGEESLKLINSFDKLNLNKNMFYSHQLYSHLEVFKNYEGHSKDTLFSAINRTKTPCGARLLKKRLKCPSINQEEIEKHYDQIDWWISNSQLLEPARKILTQMGDGERKLGKIVQPNCNGRDILSLSLWLDLGLEMGDLLKNKFSIEKIEKAHSLRDKIKHVVSSSCPPLLKEGGLINKGVNPQLDEWMNLAKNAQASLLKMEQREQKKLQIPSLKIRYNNVFGYYIEIRKIHNSKVPSHYMRKQTLTQAERYTTAELSSLEEKILSARSRQIEMEYQIFKDLRGEVLEALPELLALCEQWSQMDVHSALAFLAIENRYTRPRFAHHLKLVNSRHPVLEQKTFHEFVPNTIELDRHQTLILTGPNMAGKSTLMRQTALTVLLAQSGCFVPADQAELPLFHKMFTRIGASDLLSQGLSTFMVEMKETAEILEKADDKSLIILDEIGRGTATFDGMSLAQSILEFLTVEKKPFLLSATHYQELTQMAQQNKNIHNGSMAIREEAGDIHFLYLLQKSPAGKSYGIATARRAGLPPAVVERACQLLNHYEQSSSKTEKEFPKRKANSDYSTLIKEISEYPLMTQSPIDAMNQIQKWQKAIQQKVRKSLKTKTQSRLQQDLFLSTLN